MAKHSSTDGKTCQRCGMVTAKWSKGWDNCPVPGGPIDPELAAFVEELINEILADAKAAR